MFYEKVKVHGYEYISAALNFGPLFSIKYCKKDNYWEFRVYGVKYNQGEEPLADRRESLVFYPQKDKNFKTEDLIKLFGITKQRFCKNKEISEFLPEYHFLANKCDTQECKQRSQCETYKKVIAEEKKLQR